MGNDKPDAGNKGRRRKTTDPGASSEDRVLGGNDQYQPSKKTAKKDDETCAASRNSPDGNIQSPSSSSSLTKTDPSPSSSASGQGLASKLDFDYFSKSQTARDDRASPAILTIDALECGLYCQLGFHTIEELKDTKIGKVFSFHGLDSTGEIAFVLFKEVAKKHFDAVEINKEYVLGNFKVKMARPDYPSGTGNVCEVNILRTTTIVRSEISNGIPEISFKFQKLSEVFATQRVGDKIDVIGMLVKDWGCEELNTGVKRDLALVDFSKATVIITLWGKNAETFSAECCKSVIAVRRESVNSFTVNEGTKYSISCKFDALVWVHPELEEAKEFEAWFQDQN